MCESTPDPRPAAPRLARVTMLVTALLTFLPGGATAAVTMEEPNADAAATTPEEEAPGWNVSVPDFSVPPRELAIDTTEGTWMSLDLSPDGRTIVFDFLGDLYTLPIAGGDAHNISSGFHWDMQPRFSPDGTQIAFVSDRDGGDNIWVMMADGSEPRRITDEDFRLPTDPAWSPDGQWIAARKHFTTQRSLGTGEIWLWHVDGGKGVPLVERPNPKFQKELGEPAFTPDGGGLYYTQNVTSGNTFEYAQDSNTELFRIQRLDLDTDETEDIAGGAGGAARPTPSPDGSKLAFVRRVRADSRLFVKDLVTGAERMVVAELDQDMQETWAVHGVYPGMAWTPDSKEVVFWSDGGIHRVDVESGTVTTVPFRVRDTRTAYEAPRHAVAVGAETFSTRMVRWAQAVPGTDSVVFESLGRLWLKQGDDAPRRLTRGDDSRVEVFPSVDRAGRWVYFVAWDDAELGEIRRVPVAGGRSRTLSEVPGHYRELAVSPDGETLVVRRAEGGRLFTPLRSMDAGIHRMSTDGGALELVTRSGSNPHFGAADDRLYLVRNDGAAEEGGGPPKKIVAMDLDGGHVRDIATSRFARELQVAPDDAHVAFVEHYRVYVAPLPRSNEAIALGPEAKGVPITRVSASGGQFLAWSADGSELSFSLGPLFETLPVAGVRNEAFTPVDEGVDLSMEVAAARPTGRVAITGARIVTMAAAGVIEDGTVLIDGDRIVAVGKDLDIPADARVIAAGGASVIPGLVDVHAHGRYAQDLIVPENNWSVLAHLALGVTTVHDPSSRAAGVFAAAEYARAGKILAPRIFSTGEIVYGARSSSLAEVESLDDALAHIRRLKAQGAISVKNYNQPRREQRQQVVEAARREQMMVVAEGGSLFHMDLNMVVDGNTGIEHNLPQQQIYDDVVQLWRQTNVGYTPTLVVGYGALRGEDWFYQNDDVWRHPILSQWVPPRALQARSVRRTTAPASDYGHVDNAAIGKQLADAGVLVHTGAHGQREGLGTHWEMEMFVAGGMTPLEAIAAASIQPARYIGLDGDLGSIEVGKLADLVIIDGDVTRDISISDRVTGVMLGGRLYDPLTLDEQVTGDRVTPPLYWHGDPASEIR